MMTTPRCKGWCTRQAALGPVAQNARSGWSTDWTLSVLGSGQIRPLGI
jgi:hypothetical protein